MVSKFLNYHCKGYTFRTSDICYFNQNYQSTFGLKEGGIGWSIKWGKLAQETP